MNVEVQQQQIVVRLTEQQDALWRQLATHTNEMRISKEGRKLFPSLKYQIEGLEDNKVYNLALEFHQVDDNRYAFWKDKWVTAEDDKVTSVKSKDTPKKVWHPFGVLTGKQCRDSEVSFECVKITNDPNNEKAVYLPTMFKYVPVLSIYELPLDYVMSYETLKKIAVVKIEYTEFFAVTEYKNKSVSSLKIATNPNAQRLRKDPTNNKKRRRFSSPSETSSSQSKREKSNVASSTTDVPLPPTMLSR